MANLPDLTDRGQIDIGFVRAPMNLPRGLRAHTVLQDQFCVAVPADHPALARDGVLPAADLAHERFIAPEQQAGTHEVGRRGRFIPNIIATPGSLVAVLVEVSLGAGVAVVPSVIIAALRIPNVIFRPLAGAPIHSGVAALFRANEPSPAVRRLIQHVNRHWVKPGSALEHVVHGLGHLGMARQVPPLGAHPSREHLDQGTNMLLPCAPPLSGR